MFNLLIFTKLMIHVSSFTFYYDYFSLFLAHLALYYTNQKQKSFMIIKKSGSALSRGDRHKTSRREGWSLPS